MSMHRSGFCLFLKEFSSENSLTSKEYGVKRLLRYEQLCILTKNKEKIKKEIIKDNMNPIRRVHIVFFVLPAMSVRYGCNLLEFNHKGSCYFVIVLYGDLKAIDFFILFIFRFFPIYEYIS